jgi:hypothetical protein
MGQSLQVPRLSDTHPRSNFFDLKLSVPEKWEHQWVEVDCGHARPWVPRGNNSDVDGKNAKTALSRGLWLGSCDEHLPASDLEHSVVVLWI